MSTTLLTRHIRAPRARVYRALVDPNWVQQWMVPDQMTSRVQSFDAREGGTFRISLTYDLPTTAGKTNPQTDSFRGRFVRLVPDTEVVQTVEFETDDPAMQGEMTITYRLADAAAAQTSSAYTRTCLRACRPPTTSWAGACPSTSSPGSSSTTTDRQAATSLPTRRGTDDLVSERPVVVVLVEGF